MVENTPIQLTDDEAELYDRQIRLWGIESQARLRNASILVIGIDGLGAEIVKNLILCGVRSVKMWDDKVVTEKDFESQLLVRSNNINENRAKASVEKAKILNPLVALGTIEEPITEKPDEYFSAYDVVISCNQAHSFDLKVDQQCRSQNVNFFSCAVLGTFGFFFTDLNIHHYSMETTVVVRSGDYKKTVLTSTSFPSLEDSLKVDLTSPKYMKMFRKVPPTIYLLKIVLAFEEKVGRKPTASEEDISILKDIRDSIMGDMATLKEKIPDVIFQCVSTKLPSAVCAILGGIVAQETIKSITKKGQPYVNFFLFDPLTLGGHVHYFGPTTD